MVTKNQKLTVLAFIEISIESSIKYEYEEATGRLVVNRFLHTSMHYPFNYGFIPGTISEDKDPLDILVLTLKQILPGTYLPVRIIGMLETEDEQGKDIKMIGVPADSVDPESEKIQNLLNLSQLTKDRIGHFFEYYKSLEKDKWVKVKQWHGKDESLQYLEKCYINKDDKKNALKL